TNGNIRVNFDCQAIKLPKLGWVSFRCSKKWTALPGKITGGIAFGVLVRPQSVAVDDELGNDRMNPRISRIHS
ncbi:MAG TPA: hypothetical protein VMW91_12590, partial [Desulfosporosinus sp.]|nr:hypothetical protein [Desulfosporosinus sp.]